MTTNAQAKYDEYRDDTRKRMIDSGLRDTRMAEMFGMHVDWIQKFRRGIIVSPGIVTLDNVNDALNKHVELISR